MIDDSGYSRLIIPTSSSGWDWNFGLLEYGHQWRWERRNFHQHMNMNKVIDYRPVQLKGARGLLTHLLETPNQFRQHIRQYVFTPCVRQ
jgi:hypothetical protein